MSKIVTPSLWVGKGGTLKLRAKQQRRELMDSWVGVQEQNTLLIPLDKGLFAKVDASNHDWLNQWNWHVTKWGYAVRFEGRKVIQMHAMVLPCEKGYQPDHINRDRLDNRIQNLRPSTKTENQGNRWKSKQAVSSKFKGVYFVKRDQKWRACCTINGKGKALGTHKTEMEAACAYNKWATQYFGEFAMLNPV